MKKIVPSAAMALLLAGAFAVTSCSSAVEPEPGGASQAASIAESNKLLQLNDALKTQLGEQYSDSWIEDKQLHVAVTSQAAADTVTKAGAVPHLVTADAAALEAALQAVTAWRTALPQEQGAAIHSIMLNPKLGSVEISVAPEQLAAVKAAAEAEQPAGDVPLTFKDSPGLATPL